MHDLKVALLQTRIAWESVDANLALYDDAIAMLPGCDLVVLPEMFTTGFSMRPELFARDSVAKALPMMQSWAAKRKACIAGSVMTEEAGKYYNRLYWVYPDGTWHTYDKRHLFSMGSETEHYTPGAERIIVEHLGWRFCPLICYDARFPVWSRNDDAFDCLVYVANWPEKRIYHWEQLLIARAIENQCYVLGVNRVGEDGNGMPHNGCSLIINPRGEIISKLTDDEGVLTATLSYKSLHLYRNEFPVLKDRDAFGIS